MAFDDEILLRSGSLSLTLAPRLGGAITRFWIDGAAPGELFRRALPEAVASFDPMGLASFPLVPFSNRIAYGRFEFEGKSFELAPNVPPHPHPLHGHGWRTPWRVTTRETSIAELELVYSGRDWPSTYRATQRLELTPEALRVHIALANEGPQSMPAGIGMHPYFDRTARAALATTVSGVWLAGDDCLPREHVSAAGEWDFSGGRRLNDLELDHCFSGWNGVALIEWPERGMRLRMLAEPVFSHLVVYVPRARDFFCVEPVSHANDAVNLSAQGIGDTGWSVLAAGEVLAGDIRFVVETC